MLYLYVGLALLIGIVAGIGAGFYCIFRGNGAFRLLTDKRATHAELSVATLWLLARELQNWTDLLDSNGFAPHLADTFIEIRSRLKDCQNIAGDNLFRLTEEAKEAEGKHAWQSDPWVGNR